MSVCIGYQNACVLYSVLRSLELSFELFELFFDLCFNLRFGDSSDYYVIFFCVWVILFLFLEEETVSLILLMGR